jgi:hypothetical protein
MKNSNSESVSRIGAIKLVRKVHDCSGAKLITLHPELVKKFSIDTWTYMEQEATADGNILLKPRKLTA